MKHPALLLAALALAPAALAADPAPSAPEFFHAATFV